MRYWSHFFSLLHRALRLTKTKKACEREEQIMSLILGPIFSFTALHKYRKGKPGMNLHVRQCHCDVTGSFGSSVRLLGGNPPRSLCLTSSWSPSSLNANNKHSLSPADVTLQWHHLIDKNITGFLPRAIRQICNGKPGCGAKSSLQILNH